MGCTTLILQGCASLFFKIFKGRCVEWRGKYSQLIRNKNFNNKTYSIFKEVDNNKASGLDYFIAGAADLVSSYLSGVHTGEAYNKYHLTLSAPNSVKAIVGSTTFNLSILTIANIVYACVGDLNQPMFGWNEYNIIQVIVSGVTIVLMILYLIQFLQLLI